MSEPSTRIEWLEADGLGGFASGTVSGIRTRRYHALLLAARRPPGERFVLVNGLDAALTTAAGTFALSSQRYAPDTIHPDGLARLESFEAEPWPRWTYRLPGGAAVIQEIFVPRGSSQVVLAWRFAPGEGAAMAPRGARLEVRPFLSGRDYHALHHENASFRFAAERRGASIRWRPYEGVPAVAALSNGEFEDRPVWYRNFLYAEERARGLDSNEDLACPGVFGFELTARREAILIFGADAIEAADPGDLLRRLRRSERSRRQGFPSRLHRAAEDYIVKRGAGTTIIAGYPWFLDWGRDTFIALRGLCLATGRLAEARDILLEWAGTVSQGMLPNRFPDSGDLPEFNSVDASLWYVIAVGDYLRAAEATGRKVGASERRTLLGAVEAILDGYTRGTRYGIGLDDDGLLRAGGPGVQLTWMDAKVGDWVVTPRVGKPVEIQALWLNALWIASQFGLKRDALIERGRASFAARFWNEPDGCLHDVVDPDGRRGQADSTFRPNQIFAVGGLPLPLVTGERARRIVDAVETRLYTPLGLRSLAPGEPGYAPRYEGGVRERDGVYHQGTVWPWLLGPFVEAWVRSRGDTPVIRREARARFLAPLLAHLDDAGLGHISEIADAEPPHTPRGCPFQAWSVGEALRLSQIVLDEKRPRF